MDAVEYQPMRNGNSALWVTCCGGGRKHGISSPVGTGSQGEVTVMTELRKVRNELLAFQLMIIPYFNIIQNIIFKHLTTQS